MTVPNDDARLADGGSHTRMFACPECGKTVASEKGLKNHRSKMHGVRGPHYGKKAKAANGRIAASSPGRATEPGINAAVHRLVSTAITTRWFRSCW